MAMTDTVKVRTGWRRRGGAVAAGAVLAVAAVLGPGSMPATRLGAGEVVGFSTVSAADTIKNNGMLAEVAAAGVFKRR